MNRRQFLIGFAQFAGVTSTTGSSYAASQKLKLKSSPIKWNHSLKSAHKTAIELDRPMLIVFGASWCTFCHKLERETLGDKRIAAIVNRDFIPVHLDFDRDSKVAKILEVESLPCTVILSPQADLLLKKEGYAEPKEFSRTLQAALERRDEIVQVRNTVPSRQSK
ncbi:MAG: thioredoxin family protein [Planctomycetes bacterium]|nr:thioredoxin family protein [Planctomycetota bacterium]